MKKIWMIIPIILVILIGIVVGRLQHEGIIAQIRCSKLKEKYVIEIKHIA